MCYQEIRKFHCKKNPNGCQDFCRRRIRVEGYLKTVLLLFYNIFRGELEFCEKQEGCLLSLQPAHF